MKINYKLLLLGLAIFLNACTDAKKKKTESETETETTHQHEDAHIKKDTNTANKHMHQSSVEDLIKRFESPERDAYQQPDKVLAYLGDVSGKKIIDIGAGSGYFSVKLADKGAYVIAADVSDEFQEALQKRIEENKIANIELRKIPYDDPGLAENEVDMVLIVNTYHHIDNRIQYFSRVKKGMKTDGELIVIDFYKKELPVGPKPDHKIAKDIVIDELTKAGFTDLNVNTELLHYQYIIRAK
ncbi:class I SAM-dependent methyltransferase [Flavobacteriaceae bacterium M23B6Z8]